MILWVQRSAILPCLGRSFLEPILNIIFLIKILLFPQAELITPSDGSHCAFPDYHMIYVNCFCVWPPSSNTVVVIGTQYSWLNNNINIMKGNRILVPEGKYICLETRWWIETLIFWANKSHFSPLRGWDREGGRQMQEGGDMGIYVYV